VRGCVASVRRSGVGCWVLDGSSDRDGSERGQMEWEGRRGWGCGSCTVLDMDLMRRLCQPIADCSTFRARSETSITKMVAVWSQFVVLVGRSSRPMSHARMN
jgi:hypothetical protein